MNSLRGSRGFREFRSLRLGIRINLREFHEYFEGLKWFQDVFRVVFWVLRRTPRGITDYSKSQEDFGWIQVDFRAYQGRSMEPYLGLRGALRGSAGLMCVTRDRDDLKDFSGSQGCFRELQGISEGFLRVSEKTEPLQPLL